MHLTKFQEFDSEDLVLCMSLFVSVLGTDAIAKFNPDELRIEWEEYVQRYLHQEELNKEQIDWIASNSIIKKEREMIDEATNASLIMSDYRTAKIYIQANISIQILNQKMRYLERFFFRYSSIKTTFELKKLENQEDVSYHQLTSQYISREL